MVRFWPNETKSDIVKGIVRFFYVIGSCMNNGLKIRLFLGLIMGPSLLSPVYGMQLGVMQDCELKIRVDQVEQDEHKYGQYALLAQQVCENNIYDVYKWTHAITGLVKVDKLKNPEAVPFYRVDTIDSAFCCRNHKNIMVEVVCNKILKKIPAYIYRHWLSGALTPLGIFDGNLVFKDTSGAFFAMQEDDSLFVKLQHDLNKDQIALLEKFESAANYDADRSKIFLSQAEISTLDSLPAGVQNNLAKTFWIQHKNCQNKCALYAFCAGLLGMVAIPATLLAINSSK